MMIIIITIIIDNYINFQNIIREAINGGQVKVTLSNIQEIETYTL